MRLVQEEAESTMSELRMDAAELETLAARVAELLAGRLTPQPPASASRPVRLLSAVEVSQWWGVGRGWVYQHAEELGAIRLGNGERPRLRFDPEQVARRLDRPQPSPPQPPSNRRPCMRLAFRADPELSSLRDKTRWPGGARTPPAAAPKNRPSAR